MQNRKRDTDVQDIWVVFKRESNEVSVMDWIGAHPIPPPFDSYIEALTSDVKIFNRKVFRS